MPQRNLTAVVLWMIGSLLSFCAVAVSVRELAVHLSVFEMLATRNAAALLALGAIALVRSDLGALLVPRRMGLHLARNLVHFTGQYAWTLGVTLLPLAVVFAIEFTTPMWVALLAALILGERLTRARLIAVIMGFAGVIVIVRPGTEALNAASLIMLGAAVCFALTAIATKRLTQDVSTFAILFWMSLIQLPINYVGADPLFFLRLPEAPLLPLLGLAVGGLLAHLCLTNAYHHGDAVIVVPLDFLRLPLIALIGFWLYREPLDPHVFVGAAIIIAGILNNLRAEVGARAVPPASRGV